MFVVIARYHVTPEHQAAFVRESTAWFRRHQQARLLFLRHVTDPAYLDVLTEWPDRATFLDALTRSGPPQLRTPHETGERFLYDTIADDQ